MNIVVKDFEEWRFKSREFLAENISPAEISWGGSGEAYQSSFLLEKEAKRHHKTKASFSIPKEFFEMAPYVACIRENSKWDLIYRIAYRIKNEERNLLKISIDPDVSLFQNHHHSVRRDIHKMHAFVRFKEIRERYVAWHHPEHLSLRLSVPFFVRRFGDKPWSIFTPDESAHWDLESLTFSKGIEQHEFTHQDDFDEIWKTYYRSTFNPARINLKMMKTEMPTKYWQSMPETAIINELMREVPHRLQKMALNQNAIAQVPDVRNLEELKSAATGCQACSIHQCATKLVFGEGSAASRVMIVGEQPGHEEDLQGRPFVGPAGQVLMEALSRLQISKDQLYITNAVKHFKFEMKEQLRLHKKPDGKEVNACRPWLENEIKFVQPKLIVGLGVTAGTSLLGRMPNLKNERGRLLRATPSGPDILLTWHPSAILRLDSEGEKQIRFQELVQDLSFIKNVIG